MSKSTPISNLPNIKKQGEPAYEQRENEIVKEILNEIDSSGNGTGGPPQQPPSNQQQQDALQQQVQQQMMEQQMMEQQMMEQQMMEQQNMVTSQQGQAPGEATLGLTPHMDMEKNAKSLVESLMDSVKPSVIVGVIVAVLSLPILTDALTKALSAKDSLKKMTIPLILMIKALIGGGLFFAANNSGVLK